MSGAPPGHKTHQSQASEHERICFWFGNPDRCEVKSASAVSDREPGTSGRNARDRIRERGEQRVVERLRREESLLAGCLDKGERGVGAWHKSGVAVRR